MFLSWNWFERRLKFFNTRSFTSYAIYISNSNIVQCDLISQKQDLRNYFNFLFGRFIVTLLKSMIILRAPFDAGKQIIYLLNRSKTDV